MKWKKEEMKTKNLCRLVRFGEFPDLLFGKSQKNQMLYFNATHYIKKKGNPKIHNVKDFQISFQHWFSAVKQTYDIKQEDIMICDEVTGDILIDECLALPFLAYIDPEFGIYIMERISDMLLNGIVCSDTWLLQAVKRRFTIDELMSNLKE